MLVDDVNSGRHFVRRRRDEGFGECLVDANLKTGTANARAEEAANSLSRDKEIYWVSCLVQWCSG